MSIVCVEIFDETSQPTIEGKIDENSFCHSCLLIFCLVDNDKKFEKYFHFHNDIFSDIKDYAVKIGIDPNDEPQLLPIAAEGLMKALPAAWKPWLVNELYSTYSVCY